MAKAYDAWNARLVDHFFSPDQASRTVRLGVTQQLLDELGDGGYDGFLNACRTGSLAQYTHRVGNVAEYACSLKACWRDEPYFLPRGFPLNIPPYVGYLGLFVLVASEGIGFHRRLAELFPCPQWRGGSYPHFDRVRELWDDLALWSTDVSRRDEQSHRGEFRPLHLGGYTHLGFLRAQTILTSAECERLPALFAEAELTPDSEVSDAQFLDVVRTHGRESLSRLTREAAEDEDLRRFLCEELWLELRAWDGVVFAAESDTTKTRQVTYAPAEIRLYRSRGRWSARACVAWPEGQGISSIFLPVSGGPTTAVGVRWGADGAEPFRCKDESYLDATCLDWEGGAVWRLMPEQTGPSRVRLRGSGVRVFAPDRGFWSEVLAPRAGAECLVAASPQHIETIRSWLQSGGGPAHPEPMPPVPSGWGMFVVARAPAGFPIPANGRTPFLRLVGGVTFDGRARRYHTFAPPRIVVGGDSSGVTLTVNGRSMPLSDVYELPLATVPGWIEVEAKRGGRILDTARFELAESYHGGDPQRVLGRADAFGQPLDGPGGWCGAWVDAGGLMPWPPPIPPRRSPTPRLSPMCSRVRRRNRWVVIPCEAGLRPGNGSGQVLHESWARYLAERV